MSVSRVLKLDYSLFADNRKRVVDVFRSMDVPQHSLLFQHGVKTSSRMETDCDDLARQDSKFLWMYGVKEADCLGMVEVDTGKSTLFIPRLGEAWAIWMGNILPPEHFKELYGVDNVMYTDEIKKFCDEYKPDVIFTTYGQNTDSDLWSEEATFEGIENFKVDNSKLFDAINQLRVYKTDKEMEVFRYASKANAQAHLDAMASCKPGMYEFQLEAMHKYSGYTKYGNRLSSFIGICGSGRNSSILHYGHAGAPNDRKMEDGDMVLCDMGTEYHCFTSDITCTYPVNGKFTEDQKALYSTVLEMNRSCQKMLKPGVEWTDVHLNANRVALEGLKKMGIVKGDIEEMMKVNLAGYFMPHGLGHFMGLDVHDVGGYYNSRPRATEIGLKSLRTRRTMEHRMLITVEPGIYFIDCCIQKMKDDPKLAQFVDFDVLAKYHYLGGCRIECDCFVTETGCEDITPAPRTIEDIEAVMAGKITSIDEIKSFVY